MCRVLGYVGSPVSLEDLFYRPDSSLVTQSLSPRMLHMMNLGGFGMAAWDRSSPLPDVPFVYRSTAVPVFDANLKSLSQKLKVDAVLAHVRGVPYNSNVSLGEQNLHPFRFEGFRWALAHNGDLFRFPEMKYALLEHVRPAIAQKIRGSTDSEWMYALLMSQLDDPTGESSCQVMAGAVDRMFRVVRKVRDAVGVDVSSPANLFLCDGRRLVAARFTFDYGCYPLEAPERVHKMQLRFLSLWFTTGSRYGLHDGEWKMAGGPERADSVMVASEPLTTDTGTWMEVPEYSLLYAEPAETGPTVGVVPLEA
jgi:predicted glutamine amidotransferase